MLLYKDFYPAYTFKTNNKYNKKQQYKTQRRKQYKNDSKQYKNQTLLEFDAQTSLLIGKPNNLA